MDIVFSGYQFQDIRALSLLVVSITALVIQLVYFLIFFTRLITFRNERPSRDTPEVSVIICARNELENLRKNLPGVLQQDYPGFQVVVVNDCSWDESGEYLESLQKKYDNLKVVTIKEQEKYQHGKKFALSLGIKAAENDILLFTDADCSPVSDQWIRSMVSNYEQSAQIILGYGGYKKVPGLLNLLIRFDTFFTALQYISYALAGRPYMGVGRNLSYRRSLFFRNKGFASHLHVMSGDDDLFINETANSQNCRVEIRPESMTISDPERTWKGWFRQKKRHLTTGPAYKRGHKWLISGYFISQALFYLSLIGLLIMKVDPQLVIVIYLIRLCIQMVVFGLGMKRLDSGDLIIHVPLFDLATVFIYPLLSLANIFRKEKHWK